MEAIDAVVIGAGVVGLACARALARRGREVLVLERHDTFGSETSARNSEVIHAGLYYPTGSRKASLCVEGSRALHAFCAGRGIAHRRCGKLVVATEAGQEEALRALWRQGEANGVDGLALLDAEEARRLEPALRCRAALLCPATGIVDSRGLMLALLGEAEERGATLVLRTQVSGGRVVDDGIVLDTAGAERFSLRARLVVNAAGLSATAVAAGLGGFPPSLLPVARYAKGSYFALAGPAPFSRLVYPLPVPGGLGIHMTLDLGGQARFGPDVEWVEGPDYGVDPARAAAFAGAVRRYWPGLPEDALVPAYAGVRPKISGPGEPPADFLIQGPADHGIAGLVNLFGIESPGLTSCLAIAEAVAAAAMPRGRPARPAG